MALTSVAQQELTKMAKGRIVFNESMREHTTIKIGGPADVWFEPSDVDDLAVIVKWADERDVPRMVFGNGSNTLVCDNGIRGIVISLAKFDYIDSHETAVVVGAGTLLSRLLAWSVEQSLTGLEPVTGIPGTVGGAVFMNAGTKDGTIGDVTRSVKWLAKGKLISVPNAKLEFAYRKLKLARGTIIVEAELELKAGNKQEIEAKVNSIRKRRGETQPLIWPSMGSIFKNPSNGPKAWQLIDDCGLKGVRVGGARISNEHANWIVNEGSATARDVEVLIKMIREHVKDETDIALEPEIIMVGER